METAIADNSFKTLGCEWRERDKKIALGGLKEVKGSFYLFKDGREFYMFNTVIKKKLKTKKITCITNDTDS